MKITLELDGLSRKDLAALASALGEVYYNAFDDCTSQHGCDSCPHNETCSTFSIAQYKVHCAAREVLNNA